MFGIGLFYFGASDLKKSKAFGSWGGWQEGLANKNIGH